MSIERVEITYRHFLAHLPLLWPCSPLGQSFSEQHFRPLKVHVKNFFGPLSSNVDDNGANNLLSKILIKILILKILLCDYSFFRFNNIYLGHLFVDHGPPQCWPSTRLQITLPGQDPTPTLPLLQQLRVGFGVPCFGGMQLRLELMWTLLATRAVKSTARG